MAELVKETADMLRGLWQEYERITGGRGEGATLRTSRMEARPHTAMF